LRDPKGLSLCATLQALRWRLTQAKPIDRRRQVTDPLRNGADVLRVAIG
jgi:hypothetical protein